MPTQIQKLWFYPSKMTHHAALSTLATISLNSMPTKSFEAIAPMLLALREEVSALRLEVNGTRKATQMEYKSLQQVVNIAQDISEVKRRIHDVRSSNSTSTTT